MVLDGLRAYLQLATGLTEVTRERATAAAKALIAQRALLPDAGRRPADVGLCVPFTALDTVVGGAAIQRASSVGVIEDAAESTE